MRILIIENKHRALHHLEKLLKEIAPEIRIAGRCASVQEAAHWLNHNKLPDLIFSVIELPDGLSFEIFRELKSKVPVIFTCPYEKYAIDAFKANGIYYLLKPLKKEELQAALDRYDKGFSPPSIIKKQDEHHCRERFIVAIGNQLKLIKAEEIAYFYTEHKIVYLVTFDGSKYVTSFTVERLEQLLNPDTFFRINRQFIISLSAIVKMIPASKSRLQVILDPATDHNTTTSFGRTDRFCKWMLGEL